MVEETDTGGCGDGWPASIEATIANVTAAQGLPAADVVFDLLSRSHRRFVCYCLRGREKPMGVPTLIGHVADLVEASASSEPTDYQRVYARLNHTTLPRLADAGVVNHDRELELVEPTDAIEAMGPVLDLAVELDFESESSPLENCAIE